MDRSEVFEPMFLFHPERGSRLVSSWEEWMVLQEQGGWVESPAEFGVITAPSREQQFLQGAQLPPGPPLPLTGTLQEQVTGLQVLVGHLQQQIDSLSAAMKTVLEAAAHLGEEAGGRRGRQPRE